MKLRRLLIFAFVIMLPLSMRGQFYSAGTDPGSARFRSISSRNFKVIYPVGADSLARAYAVSLQQQYPLVGLTIGYDPSECWKAPLPVVLHAHHSYANGMVMWAPRRMELYTVGDPYDPDPLPWMLNLTTHESRHSSQMQFPRKKGFRVGYAIAGELSDVAWWAAYPGIVMSEGDAVVAETELTRFGRGRGQDFLEYVRASFAEGEYCDMYRWMYGSQKLYTPDHYRAGYMTIAGMRAYFDCPNFTERYLDNIFKRKLPLPFFNLNYTAKEVAGMGIRAAFDSLSRGFAADWAANDALRLDGGSFDEGETLTGEDRRFTQFKGAVAVGEDIYAVETGLERSARLVRISPDGSRKYLGAMSSLTSDLALGGNALFWSEYRRDPRWGLAGESVIVRMDIAPGKRKTVLKGGKYYNPSPSADGRICVVVEHPFEGGSRLRAVLTDGGETLWEWKAPAGMQIVQYAHLPCGGAFSAITDDGFGVYCLRDGALETLLSPTPAKIKQLRSLGDEVYFVCDRDGVNELYRLSDGGLCRMTNLKQGGQDFVFNSTLDTLRYTALTPSQRRFYKIATSSLKPLECTWGEVWEHPVAAKLSEQARQMAVRKGVAFPPANEADTIAVSEPVPYSKAAHLLRFHSWLPLYLDYDIISNFSFSSIYNAATLGATAFFQNDLSTASGSIGYSATPQAKGEPWRHSADIRFNWSGWYPVIESTLSISSSDRHEYKYVRKSLSTGGTSSGVSGRTFDGPLVAFSTKVYVPLYFNSGGWNRGLIPQIRYNFSNNLFDSSVYFAETFGTFKGYDKSFMPLRSDEGHMTLYQNLSASIRGYAMLPTAPSGVYPRWGIGAELGVGMRPTLTRIYEPSAYAYLYGYLPGILPSQGLRLSALSQIQIQGGYIHEQRVTTLPRGIPSSSAISRFLSSRYPFQTKMTADYMAAVLPIDASLLCPVAYIRNFEVGAHCDFSFLVPRGASSSARASSAGTFATVASTDASAKSLTAPETLMSLGGSLSVRLGNLLFVPFPTRIGVTFSYNCGSAYQKLVDNDTDPGRTHAGLIFSIDY